MSEEIKADGEGRFLVVDEPDFKLYAIVGEDYGRDKKLEAIDGQGRSEVLNYAWRFQDLPHLRDPDNIVTNAFRKRFGLTVSEA